VLKGKSHQVQ